MSMDTWKKEFYPTDADNAANSDLKAIEHSLRKWRGLKPHVIKKHGLQKSDESGYKNVIWEQEKNGKINQFIAGSLNCALCIRHFETSFITQGKVCVACPLYRSRLGHACIDRRPNEFQSPWEIWTETGDPRRMIGALEMALKKLQTGKI